MIVRVVWQRTRGSQISSSGAYPIRFPKESNEALHLVWESQPPCGGNLPVGSRTKVPKSTYAGLTAGFEMRPGVSLPLWPSNHRYPDYFYEFYTQPV